MAAMQAETPAEVVHQCRAHVHGGAFPADGGAAEQGQDRQQHLGDGHRYRQQLAAQARRGLFQAGDHLGNAATLGLLQPALGQPGEQGEAQWGDQPGPVDTLPQQPFELLEGMVGQPGESQRDEADQQGAEPESRTLAQAAQPAAPLTQALGGSQGNRWRWLFHGFPGVAGALQWSV